MLIFFKVFFEKLFQEYHQSVKKVWIQFIGPELGPNCLQWLSAEDTDNLFVCLFLLLYVPCQQLWSLRDGQFT